MISWILVTIIADVGWHWLHGLKVHLRQVKCRALTFAVVADIEGTISKASPVGAFAVVGIHSWLVLKLAATQILWNCLFMRLSSGFYIVKKHQKSRVCGACRSCHLSQSRIGNDPLQPQQLCMMMTAVLGSHVAVFDPLQGPFSPSRFAIRGIPDDSVMI